jgi:hypothetical protein
MRMGLCLRAAATAGLALAGYMASSAISFGIVGVSSAEAAQFYSRKRINGQWVTGRFPKATRVARPSRTRQVARVKGIRPVIDVPASAKLAALSAPELRREDIAAAASPMTTGTLAERAPPALAMPDIEAALVSAAVGPVPPADETGPAAEARVMKLREALQARANDLKAKSETEPARPTDMVGAAPKPEQAVPLPVAAASATASEGVTGPLSTNSIVPALAVPTSPGRGSLLAPRSVFYDFETGIKTTVFESSVVREPFDRAAMRGLVAGSLATR